MANLTIDLSGIAASAVNQVAEQALQRAVLASNELRNAELYVMRGSRSGKTYKTPAGGSYKASAPGEPPAVRTGTLRNSFQPVQHGTNGMNPAIETLVKYAAWMENGTPGGKIAPRPFVQPIIDKAMPAITAIYAAPYNITP